MPLYDVEINSTIKGTVYKVFANSKQEAIEKAWEHGSGFNSNVTVTREAKATEATGPASLAEQFVRQCIKKPEGK